MMSQRLSKLKMFNSVTFSLFCASKFSSVVTFRVGIHQDRFTPKTIIRKTGNLGSALKHDLKEILEGKNPNPYREDTLLDKAIREGYMACQCSNCSADFSHMNGSDRQPPLILDFLDRRAYDWLAPIHNSRDMRQKRLEF